MLHKAWNSKGDMPFVFQGHPSNFKVTRGKTSPILTQIGRFRTIGRSQLSNPSYLPCYLQVTKLGCWRHQVTVRECREDNVCFGVNNLQSASWQIHQLLLATFWFERIFISWKLRAPVGHITGSALQWHHNGYDGVSNHQCLDCLVNHLFRLKSKKTSNSASLAFVCGIHRWPWIPRTNDQ